MTDLETVTRLLPLTKEQARQALTDAATAHAISRAQSRSGKNAPYASTLYRLECAAEDYADAALRNL